MSVTATPAFTQKPRTSGGSITNSTGAGTLGTTTNAVGIFTAGVNGSRVTALKFSTSDTAANNVFLSIQPGGSGSVTYPIGQINVPLSSGNVASTLDVDGLNNGVVPGLPIDNNGKRFIHLAANDVLMVSVIAAVTSGKTLFAAAMGEDY